MPSCKLFALSVAGSRTVSLRSPVVACAPLRRPLRVRADVIEVQPARAWADRAGSIGSGLCLVHCVAMAALPGLVAALGIGGVFLASFEWGLVGFAVCIALYSAFSGYRRHRSLRISGALAGFALLLVFAIVMERAGNGSVGWLAMLAAGIGLVTTHSISARARTPAAPVRSLP